MVYILHIDTSDEIGVFALSKDGTVIKTIRTTETRNHASSINVNIEQLLSESSLKTNDINAISVCSGPGSYTGLRIGLATAKGLCYALNKHLLMHNRLTLLAAPFIYDAKNKNRHLVVALEARAEEYFIAVYKSEPEEVFTPQHILASDLDQIKTEGAEVQLIGHSDDTLTCHFELDESKIHNSKTIDIDSWARYAFEQYNCNNFVNLANSEPDYLKKVHTHKPKKNKHL